VTRSKITDGYLAALGGPSREPNSPSLAELVRRHVAIFSFSSSGCRLGEELRLDLDSLHDRIVVRRRGGYCFEQNGLFFEILKELGYRVELCLARVIYNEDTHPGLTHRVTIVTLDGIRYVADVGFGADGPRIPVPIAGQEVRDQDRTYRIAAVRDGEWHLQILKDGGFFSLYRFELARYGQADCELGHFYSHRHPNAAFVNHLVISRILDREVRSLRDRDYWVFAGADVRRQNVENANELGRLVRDEFGIRVTDAEVRRLFTDLP